MPAERADAKSFQPYLVIFVITLSKFPAMKRWAIFSAFIVYFLLGSIYASNAQCSICARTSQQLGEKPARALNTGILYLAAAPVLIAGFIGYRWWKGNGGGNF